MVRISVRFRISVLLVEVIRQSSAHQDTRCLLAAYESSNASVGLLNA